MGVLAAPADPGASGDLTRSSLPIRPLHGTPLTLRKNGRIAALSS
jgi:hypothetical protein